MLFGMIQFGLVLAGWAAVRNSVQTGARMVAIGQLGSPAPCAALTAAELQLPPPPPSSAFTTTATAYCTIVAQIGSPVGTAVSSTAAPYPEVGFLVQDGELTVCAQVQGQNLTGLFNLTPSSSSSFYIEDPSIAANLENYNPYVLSSCD
jgi:Flp pilus assembly protein TadG